MPTFNQLVRQGRKDKVTKSKTPALQRGFLGVMVLTVVQTPRFWGLD